MKLEEFWNNPIEAYLKAERYVNNGSRSGIKNTTSVETSPLSSVDAFELYSIETDNLICIGQDKEFVFPSKYVLIHPDLVESELLLSYKGCISKTGIKVNPTASGRTTYCSDYGCFIKLAYFEILGRIPRHIGLDILQSAFEVTKNLKSLIDSEVCNSSFAILREDKGLLIKLNLPDRETYELGVIFREGKPYPSLPEYFAMVPFFSLFSKEFKPDSNWELCEHQDEPLIVQLFLKQSEFTTILDFTLNKILKPLFHTYFDALLFGGIELEAHAQNMLISISRNFEVKQIVCRDLESAGRDISLMQERNISFNDIAKSYKYIKKTIPDSGEKYSTYQRTHSFMFDFKLGEYIVTPIIECICDFDPTINRVNLVSQIKLYNNSFIRQFPNDYFPVQWCDYDDVVWGDSVKKIYNWHDNPKYR